MGAPLRRPSKEGPFLYHAETAVFLQPHSSTRLALEREANFSVVVSRRIRLAESKKPGWLLRGLALRRLGGPYKCLLRLGASKRVDLIAMPGI